MDRLLGLMAVLPQEYKTYFLPQFWLEQTVFDLLFNDVVCGEAKIANYSL